MLNSVDSPILTEGAVMEIIRRRCPDLLDPYIANAAMIRTAEGRIMLSNIYRSYIESGISRKLPTLVFAPTSRCQPERLAQSSIDVGISLNVEVIQFLKSIVKPYLDRGNVLLGAIIGSKGDPYLPEQSLSEEESYVYHKAQVDVLTIEPLDVIQVATQPSMAEAAGISRLLSETRVPYIVSFMINPAGTLLDGKAISEAICYIDDLVEKRPVFYMSNCIHPDHFLSAYHSPVNDSTVLKSRFKGLQANTSNKMPEELNESSELHLSETPEEFAKKMIQVRQACHLNLLGGCCGTDEAHINLIAHLLS